jgi:uncharacterized protein (UPF0335 family)
MPRAKHDDGNNEPINVSYLRDHYVPRFDRAMQTLEEARGFVKDLKAEMKDNGYDPKLADQAYKVRKKKDGYDRHIKTRDMFDFYLDAFEGVSEQGEGY